jgi:hypothetical protein
LPTIIAKPSIKTAFHFHHLYEDSPAPATPICLSFALTHVSTLARKRRLKRITIHREPFALRKVCIKRLIRENSCV